MIKLGVRSEELRKFYSAPLDIDRREFYLRDNDAVQPQKRLTEMSVRIEKREIMI